MIKHICRLHLNCLLSAVILMLMVPFLTGFDISQQVTILYDGQTKEVRTNAVKPGKNFAGGWHCPGEGRWLEAAEYQKGTERQCD